MKITIEHRDGKYPSFNVHLHTAEGRDPFLTIRDCRLVNGSKGDFISFPAKKLDSGKYINHVVGSDQFQAAVLQAVRDSEPPPPKREKPKDEAWRAMMPDDEIPF